MRRRNGSDLSSSDCLELTAGVGDQSNPGHQRLGDDVNILHSDQQVIRSVPDALRVKRPHDGLYPGLQEGTNGASHKS